LASEQCDEAFDAALVRLSDLETVSGFIQVGLVA
jgi:hypothetical protein